MIKPAINSRLYTLGLKKKLLPSIQYSLKMKRSQPIPLWGNSKPNINLGLSLKDYRLYIRPYMWLKGFETPNIVSYLLPSPKPRPAVIIAPGGAYMIRARHEGVPIAKWLNSVGISAFVLNYRQGPYRHPIPFLDAQRAIRLIRGNAQKFGINPDCLGMLGFSAGGHLTASIGTLTNRSWFPPTYQPDEIDRLPDVPNFLVLCYPVISMKRIPHGWSLFNLLGRHPDPKMVDLLSLETQITAATPPTFIWTTHDDNIISDAHSTSFIEGLRNHKIPNESYIFPHGRHGLALANGIPEISQWPSFCETWLKKQGFL
jgi:acetyl esterase/lipase